MIMNDINTIQEIFLIFLTIQLKILKNSLIFSSLFDKIFKKIYFGSKTSYPDQFLKFVS